MKTCPVCKARCFDDMEICYGCMHRFKEEAGEARWDGASAASPEDLGPSAPAEGSPAVSGGAQEAPSSAEAVCRPGGDPPKGSAAGRFAGPGASAEDRRGAGKAPRHERQRVFGAMAGDDAREWVGEAAPADAAAWPPPAASVGACGANAGFAPARFELAPGILAVAPLGNGFRLVLSVERG